MKPISTRLAGILPAFLLTLLANSANAAEMVAVHSGPGRNHTILEFISTSDRIDGLQCTQQWCAVHIGSRAGWIYEPDLPALSNILNNKGNPGAPPARIPAPHPLDRPTAPEPHVLEAPPERL
ncbi:hypothetical protein [Devosia sp. MC521]|uniref:hypothetical protein n=1 Tax=Devosia sp. MC521 TaxID=2759954 RepID=UPI0015FAE708|nr:hypothetical protein [Devosia sp. MC521]MBJ6986771.1 hypothetical protein [Devosia sp. MC521]QMW61803.1 hypothetical protein H4N61_12630 [Devosia sp. MC521]